MTVSHRATSSVPSSLSLVFALCCRFPLALGKKSQREVGNEQEEAEADSLLVFFVLCSQRLSLRTISFNLLHKPFHVELVCALPWKSSSAARCIEVELTTLLLLIKQGEQNNLSFFINLF